MFSTEVLLLCMFAFFAMVVVLPILAIETNKKDHIVINNVSAKSIDFKNIKNSVVDVRVIGKDAPTKTKEFDGFDSQDFFH